MLGKFALAALAVITHACTFDQRAGGPGEFRLCSDNPAFKSTISMSFANLSALSDDYGRPIAKCTDTRAACISFPFLLSVPPRLPTDVGEVVSWSVGDDQFTVRLLPGADEAFFIEAIEFRPGADGRPQRLGGAVYTYAKDIGIMTFRAEGDKPHGLVRCAGRLTFDDLQKLANRVP